MRRVTEIGEELGIKVQVRHGDTTQSARAKQAKAPPEMLITTPETLQAILTGKKMLEHLKGVRWVVVDEIHELATDERGVQLSLALERLQHLTGRPFQRIGLSATVGEAEKVANFLGGTGREVVIAKAGEEKAFSIQVNYINPTAEDQRDADRLGLPAQTIARAKTIAKIIKEKKSTLVFTNTREHAEAVGSQIHALYEKLPVRVHHGSLSREVREEAEKDFQAGKVKAVICTSSLELGIDVGSVDFIVQYMSPRQSTTFVQRIGRSGHTLHGHSRGEIIGTTADDMLESAAITTCAASGNLERTLIHEKALDVLAHQIVGLALTEKRIPVGQVFDIVRGAYPYRALTMDELLDVIHFLESLRLIRVYDDVLAPAYPRSYGYYYENLSVIPDVKRFTVFDFFSKRRIGTLDQDFVARKCKPGTRTVFIMHGTTWRTVQTDEDRQTIDVEPTAPSLDAIPSWEGDMTPVSFEIAQTVGRLRARIAENINNAPALRKIREDINLTEAAMDRVVETIRTHMEHHPLPTDKHMVIEKFEHCIIIHTCLGSIVNETLAVTLAALLSARHGVSMITQVDPYRIALISRFRFEPEIVAQEIRKFVSEDFKPTFIQFLQNSDLFAWRNWQVARRFGVVERKADYFTGRARMIVKAMQGTPLTAETLRELLLEKFDLDAAVKIIGEIGSGEITVDLTSEWGQTCSPLAIPIVDKIIPHDLLRPALATKSLTDMVKERLYADTMRLVCMWNGDWDAIRIVGDLPERFKCPKCGSTLIAATYPRNDTLSAIVRKVKIGKTLTKEEKHTWQQGTKSASLVQTHGKKAVVVMTGRGIGPETATRVLRAPQHVEEELYATILKAERQYARTRLFWDGF
jgi:ATP-dependent Lhr-like helicase